MKKTIKSATRIVLGLLVAAMTFCLFSCKNQDAETGVLPEGYVPDIAGELRLTCATGVHNNDEAKKSIMSWLNAFRSRYDNVTVKVEYVDETLIPTMASAHDLGDVFFMSDGHLPIYQGTYRALMPLDYYIEAFNIDTSDIYTGIYDLSVFDGKYYFVGMCTGNVTFSYNVDELVKAGILEPDQRIPNDWTWDDFKSICAQLVERDTDGVTLKRVGAQFNMHWSNMFSPFLYAFGDEPWYDTVNKKLNLFSEGVRKGISEAIYCIDNRYIYPQDTKMSSAMQKEYKNISGTNTVFRFNASYTVMPIVVNDWINSGVTFDCAPWPLYDNPASPCGSLGFGVFAYTTNKDAAAALALFLLTPEGQRSYHSQAGGDVPCLQSVSNEDFWHLTGSVYDNINHDAFIANYDRYVPGQVNAVVPPEIALEIQEGMGELYDNYCTGKKDWVDSLEELQTTCNEMWDQMNWH